MGREGKGRDGGRGGEGEGRGGNGGVERKITSPTTPFIKSLLGASGGEKKINLQLPSSRGPPISASDF